MDLLKASEALLDESVALRRHFHMHPELSNQEFETSKTIAQKLNELGYEVRTGVGKTGVVGLMQGGKPGPVFMLRFDMDALPVTEENDVAYVSKNPGVMHACGHDSHMTVGLTIAKMIKENLSEMAGTYKLVFQPAEEGGGGALAMIADKVLEDPKPDYALGMHVWNEAPLGWMSLTAGPIMAGSGRFDINVVGKGGHGAVPQSTHDPVLASAHIITALQSIVSRNIAPVDSGVVTVSRVQGGTAHNIIPPNVQLSGTYRYFLPEAHAKIKAGLERISEQVAAAFECTATVSYDDLTPPVVNDGYVTSKVTEAYKKLDGSGHLETNYRTMGAEDMAYFLEKIPGCFIFAGSANSEEGKNFPHHHPRFDIDERVMVLGPALILQTCQELAAASA